MELQYRQFSKEKLDDKSTDFAFNCITKSLQNSCQKGLLHQKFDHKISMRILRLFFCAVAIPQKKDLYSIKVSTVFEMYSTHM